MITEQEHKSVPAIRGWLAATSHIEIPTGLSREEARLRAQELLAAIIVGNISPDHVEVNDELKDVLWAAVMELYERPLSQQAFKECDRVYQFVLALSVSSDPFDERNELLQRVARIGWRSAPGGIEAILKVRAAVWEHCDEARHRVESEAAACLPARIKAIRRQDPCNVAELLEVCSTVLRLGNSRPALGAAAASDLLVFLEGYEHRLGWLDDRQFLKGVAGLASGMAGRQTGRLDVAELCYARSRSAFSKTLDTSDVVRVDVERLALHHSRGDFEVAAELAPTLISRIRIPRERVKAELTLASALVDLDRYAEAVKVLESVCEGAVIQKEPPLWAYALLKLGNVLSELGRDEEAMSSFRRSGAVLANYHYPVLLGGLAAVMGEHFARHGYIEETVRLYRSSRDTFLRAGHAQQTGYLSVLLAEMLIMLGRIDEAEAELLAALPLIEKFNLRREGVAAVALLRDAMAKRSTDVTTIRTLREQLRRGLH